MECVKCGYPFQVPVNACHQCSWPCSLDAWSDTEFQIKRVTIDTSCINAKQLDPDLNILETWAEENHIKIERSDALIKELLGQDRIAKAEKIQLQPQVWILGQNALGIDTVLAGPDVSGPVQEILFPTTKILTNNQEYDVEHLRTHVLTGGDVFVTRNPNDFLVRGRQSSLACLGIWVFDPPGVVEFLVNLYGWEFGNT